MMPKILSFDIETIPDLENLKKIYDITSINDDDAWNIIQNKRLEKSGTTFLPHYLHKVICISLVLQDSDQIKVWSIGQEHEAERDIIQRFFSGIEKYHPILVSWNGGGFDLPVLHYRSILHNVIAPSYWETGEHHPEFKWNNYLSRYHQRHTDLMDFLANYQNKAFAPLDEFSQILGLPGKIGLHGHEVFTSYRQGKLSEICDYCEADVLNTHLIYLRFLLTKAQLSNKQYREKLEQLDAYLKSFANKPHWQQFLVYINQQIAQLPIQA